MISRLAFLLIIPSWMWPLLAAGGCCGMGLFVLVGVLAPSVAESAENFHNQCDSAVGPDPSVTVTPTHATATGSSPRGTFEEDEEEGLDPENVPTSNPYASMTIAPDDTSASAWQRACVSAMRTAPLQAPAKRSRNVGFAAECARDLALAQVGPRDARDAGGGAAATPEDMARYVIYQATTAALTGHCERSGAAAVPSTDGPARQSAGSGQQWCGQPLSRKARPVVVTLPNTLAEQGACGQRVELSAMSAGDLVFWDYWNNSPTRVGIATDATHIVTDDPRSGQFVEQRVPADDDVRVKRVVGGGL